MIMKKNSMKKETIILLVIWILLLFLIPTIVLKVESNISSNNLSYLSSSFDIEKYDVTLDVDRDNKVDVTEMIMVNLPDENYNGIYKSIPLWQHYYNKDMKESSKKVEITNLRVIGEKFNLDENINNIGIRIGSEKVKYDKGSHVYIIKYRYDMGIDQNKGFDEFVFNIFDSYDKTKINNFSVKVNMPDGFDENDVKFLKKDKIINDKVKYYISGNSLYAMLNDYSLDDSLTINFTLPDNYFIGGSSNYGNISLIICFVIILIAICGFIFWIKYGKNFAKRVPTVEFYAPDDLDPAQVGYIYGEKDIKKLTTALIISLASKNYISIKEMKSKKCKIVNTGKKKKNLKSLSAAEQIVYLELFKNSDSNILCNDKSFGITFNKVQKCLEITMDKKVNDLNSQKMVKRIFALLFVSVIAWSISYLFINDLNPRFDVLYLLSFIAIFITGFFSIFMGRKTEYGEVISAKILGFKNYLETAEKNSLNLAVSKNPDYFYDILPYTYVLGISKKWINKFEKENVPNIDLSMLDLYEDNFFMVA